MDFESFFGTPRWKILEIIAKNPSSPIEIAAQVNTSVSYVSQQLKLLEVARIVQKQKTGLVEKGKPRNVYSLTSEFLYITALTKKSQDKKILFLDESHKSILSIWLLDDISYHRPLQKIYWEIEEDIGEIDGLYFEKQPKNRIILLSESKKIKAKIESLLKRIPEKIDLLYSSLSQAGKLSLKDAVAIIGIKEGKNEK